LTSSSLACSMARSSFSIFFTISITISKVSISYKDILHSYILKFTNFYNVNLLEFIISNDISNEENVNHLPI
jgi:hypothetical protein